MRLFSWIARRRASAFDMAETATPPATAIVENSGLDGLYLGLAVQSHLAWKQRLRTVVREGRHDAVDVAELAADDLCALGQWLHGTARARYGHLPQFARLRKAHAEFHLTAAQVVLLSRQAQRAAAQALLRGAFDSLSDRVQLELVRLHSAARAQ